MAVKECGGCHFFREQTCRHDPPVRLPRKFDDKATAGNRVRLENLEWGWPHVNSTDWCGKWKWEGDEDND